MLKALYVLAMLTGWGPAYQFGLLSYSAATYENQYHQILRLHRESQRLPESERSQRAQALADKALHTYESLQYLSFTKEVVDYWCTEGDWRSYLPMEHWPKRPVASATTAMTPESLHTEILVQGRPLYSLFLKDLEFSEYRWPWAGLPGEYTTYPYSPRCSRLCRGVDDHVRCVTGALRRPWIGEPDRAAWFRRFQELGGPRTTQPRNWQRLIEQGQWIGLAQEQGERCDLVLLDMDDANRRDVFFIDQQGFLILWYIITRETEDHRNKWIVVTWCRDYRTDPIPESDFSPSQALLDQAKSWRKLSGDEALAEYNEVQRTTVAP